MYTSDVLVPSRIIPLGGDMGSMSPFGPDHMIEGTDVVSDPTAAVHCSLNTSPAISLSGEVIVASDAVCN